MGELQSKPIEALLKLAAAQGGQVHGGEEGVLMDWKEDGGYGFLMMDDGRRAYIHRSMLGLSQGSNLPLGFRLRVTTGPDPRNPGKWCVETVIGSVQDSPGKPLIENAARQPSLQIGQGPAGEEGVVTDWKEEGGYGFLMMDDGRRAYVHRTMLASAAVLGIVGPSLVVGTRLRVLTRPDSRNPGKWCVEHVLGDVQDTQGLQAQAEAYSTVTVPLAV